MKRLYRSKKERKIAGICGGLGELFDIDPTLIRLGFVIIAFATGVLPLVLAYLVSWWIVPEEPVVEASQEQTAPSGADAT